MKTLEQIAEEAADEFYGESFNPTGHGKLSRIISKHIRRYADQAKGEKWVTVGDCVYTKHKKHLFTCAGPQQAENAVTAHNATLPAKEKTSASESEKCEGCSDKATTWDSEGVPLCTLCAALPFQFVGDPTSFVPIEDQIELAKTSEGESKTKTLLRSMINALDTDDDITYWKCFEMFMEITQEVLPSLPAKKDLGSDTARLDWLEKSVESGVEASTDLMSSWVASADGKIYKGDTIRAAIDSAMGNAAPTDKKEEE